MSSHIWRRTEGPSFQIPDAQEIPGWKILRSFCPFLANPPQGKVVTLENFARWTCQPFHIWKNGVILHQGWVWTLREGKNLLQVSDWNPMNQIVLQSTAWGLKMHWQCAYWRAGSFKYSNEDITYLNQCPGKIFTNSRLNIFWVSRARFLILSTYFCSNFAFLAARAVLLVSAVSSVIIGRTAHSKGQFNSRKFPGADIWPVLRYSLLLLDQIIFFWGRMTKFEVASYQYRQNNMIGSASWSYLRPF